EPVVTMIKVEKVKEERVDDLELLLSMETQTRVDALVEKDSTPKRPTTIKFELPTLPLRATNYPRTTANQPLPEEGLIANERRKKRLSWKNLFKEEEVIAYVTMDARVRLKMRPLPTFGYVKYIGGVGFGKGEWVGIELDHRVGNCDGSMNGQRYFITDHHRGIFCKRNDLEAVV
ncbi:CAP-GLY domain-containing linker protein 1, partial [Rhizopus stolonifer]